MCQVGSADMTFIPVLPGFMYLAAVMDRFRRHVSA
jgi:hypothetical protein